MSAHTPANGALEPLRYQLERLEEANRRAGHHVIPETLICLTYSEARALLDSVIPPVVGQP